MRNTLLLVLGLAGCAAPREVSPPPVVLATPPPRTTSAPTFTAAPLHPNAPACDVMGFYNTPGKQPYIFRPRGRLAFMFGEHLHNCGVPHTLEIALEIIGHTCSGPFENADRVWKEATARDFDYYDAKRYTQSFYDRGWNALLGMVRDVVDPACVWKATDHASTNPRFAECPMPRELIDAFRRFPDEKDDALAYVGSLPAGLYAFVSALAASDSSAMGRALQLKILWGGREAVPYDASLVEKGECAPSRFSRYEGGLQPD